MNQNKTKYVVIGVSAVIVLIIIAVFVISARRADIEEKREAAKLTKINTLTTEADFLINKGEWNKALEKYEEASKEDPGNSSLWSSELNNRIYMSKTEEDVKKIEELLNNKTAENPQTFLTKTLILSKIAPLNGEFQQAINYLEEIKKFLEKNDLPGLTGIEKEYFLSSIMATESYFYLFLGDTKNAEDLNAQSLVLAPKNSLAHYFKSLIILDKDFDNIAPALEEAKIAVENLDEFFSVLENNYGVLDKTVTKAKILVQLGDLYRQTGDLEQAERYINEGIDLIDIEVYPFYYLFQVRINFAKGDLKKAEEYLNKWNEAETVKKPNYYLIKAMLDIENKEFNAAKVSLDKALELSENLGPPHWVVTPNNKMVLKREINKLLIKIKDKNI